MIRLNLLQTPTKFIYLFEESYGMNSSRIIELVYTVLYANNDAIYMFVTLYSMFVANLI